MSVTAMRSVVGAALALPASRATPQRIPKRPDRLIPCSFPRAQEGCARRRAEGVKAEGPSPGRRDPRPPPCRRAAPRLPADRLHSRTDGGAMAIDFTFPEEVRFLIERVRRFCNEVVRPTEAEIAEREDDRETLVRGVIKMRKAAREQGLWLPHMPAEYGGMGLGHLAMAAVSAEAGKTRFGPFALNCQAADEDNMHTVLHWRTPEQKQKYLRPLCEGKI